MPSDPAPPELPPGRLALIMAAAAAFAGAMLASLLP